MSQGRLQSTIAKYRADLLAREHDAEVALEHAYQHTLSQIQPRLDALYSEIQALSDNGDTIPPSWLYEAGRLVSIKQLVQHEISRFASLAQTTTHQLQEMGVQLGQTSAMQMLHDSLPGINYNFGVPSTKAIESLIGATQKGSPLADLFAGFGSEAAKNVGNALVTGLSLGDNPRVVADSVMQALGVPRWRALTCARTEMLRSYRSASLETYRANSDVVGQWRWTCDLSARTCLACLMEDGTLHDLDEEMQSHVNCRCTAIPVTKSYDEILSGLNINIDDIPESSISASDMPTGEEWFMSQDEETQRKVMGNAAYNLWQDDSNDISLSDFVGRDHSEDWGTGIRVRSVRELTR